MQRAPVKFPGFGIAFFFHLQVGHMLERPCQFKVFLPETLLDNANRSGVRFLRLGRFALRMLDFAKILQYIHQSIISCAKGLLLQCQNSAIK